MFWSYKHFSGPGYAFGHALSPLEDAHHGRPGLSFSAHLSGLLYGQKKQEKENANCILFRRRLPNDYWINFEVIQLNPSVPERFIYVGSPAKLAFFRYFSWDSARLLPVWYRMLSIKSKCRAAVSFFIFLKSKNLEICEIFTFDFFNPESLGYSSYNSW